MDMPIDSEDNRHMIQLKTCPRCKTAIRRSQRYGNVIKQQLLDIEKVKAKVNGNQDEIETTREDLKRRLQVLRPKFAAKEEWSVLMKRVNKISNSVVAAVVTNQVMLMERFLPIDRKLKAKLPNNRSQSEGMFTSVFFRLARFESLYLKRSQGDTPLLRQIKLLKPNVLQYPTPPPSRRTDYLADCNTSSLK